MKKSKMGSAILSALALSVIMATVAPVVWSGPDVYVIYSGKNKSEKKQLLKAFPREISTKSYNADLLSIADYSGIQKALTKFERAKVIVILRDRPMELLKGARVKKDLFILHSTRNDLSSSGWKLHVLTQGEDISTFGSRVTKRIISKRSDLDDIESIRKTDLLLVNEAEIKMAQSVSLLVKNHLAWK